MSLVMLIRSAEFWSDLEHEFLIPQSWLGMETHNAGSPWTTLWHTLGNPAQDEGGGNWLAVAGISFFLP